MFENAGQKVQSFAIVVFALGCIGSIVGGVSLASLNVISCVITIAVGVLMSYIFALILYTVGHTLATMEELSAWCKDSVNTLNKYTKENSATLQELSVKVDGLKSKLE